MVDQAFFLRAGDAGPEVKGTPGNVLTFQEDGKVRGETPASGGGVQHAAVVVNWVELTSGQLARKAGVNVPGILAGDLAWCTPSGPNDDFVLPGIVGCWAVADGQVDIIGLLFSLDPLPTSVLQPVTVFWITP
jgi:hypothetical protein